MRIRILALAAAAVLGACQGTTGPEAPLAIEAPPDFTATVARIQYTAGYTPAGWGAQYDLWLVVPPGSAPNAGLTLPLATPVFVHRGGRTYAATVAEIQPLDHVRVWHDRFVGYGAAEAPPDAPIYTGTQIVILR